MTEQFDDGELAEGGADDGELEAGALDVGALDLGALLERAQAVQQHLREAQESVADQVVEGHAGGGAVSVRVNGALEFVSASISPDAVAADDVEMLEDLVVAACNDAMARVKELNDQVLGDVEGLGGLGLGR